MMELKEWREGSPFFWHRGMDGYNRFSAWFSVSASWTVSWCGKEKKRRQFRWTLPSPWPGENCWIVVQETLGTTVSVPSCTGGCLLKVFGWAVLFLDWCFFLFLSPIALPLAITRHLLLELKSPAQSGVTLCIGSYVLCGICLLSPEIKWIRSVSVQEGNVMKCLKIDKLIGGGITKVRGGGKS